MIELTEEQLKELNRDYIQNPLKRGERISKEILQYLYIDLSFSDFELMEFFHKSKFYIQKCRYFYKIYKTREEVLNKRYKTNMEKYGGISPFCNKNVKEKVKETNLERYGVENAFQNKDIQNKFKQTSLEKYGTEYPFQNKDIQEKYKETSKKNNGCEWGLSSEKIKQKSKETCLKKYGVENCMQSEQVKEKYKQTCLEKYGVDNYTKSNLYNGTEVTYKAYETKKKNCTINTSKQEILVFEKLKIKFKNVQYQYREKRYPFNCDFYIPELDLFIELNFHWTHGVKPYNKDEDEKELEYLKNKVKESEFYENAIEVWTKRDPLKRQTAKQNNLNWIEFFSMKEFENWYNNLER